MQLFKRILLSLFPDETVNQGINPASMFISFISTKEFFSVINRKIVENYKLNLFDITIDPFEFKIGFGENIHIKQKDIDTYYSYCATANMNGYRLFNPANIGNSVTLVTSIYTKEIFSNYPQEYFINFLYTVYLLFFVFSAKIKIFPFSNKQDNYNRFVLVFFNFYEFIFQQTGKNISKEELEKTKKELLSNIEIFFFLFYSYQKCNNLFNQETTPNKDFYTWLLGDEIKTEQKELLEELTQKNKDYTHRATFGNMENKLLQFILPADILLRYLFLETNTFLIIEVIISKIFDKKTIDTYLQSFLKNDNQRENCILYITDYKQFKKAFFQGVEKYILTTIKKESILDIEEDEEMMSRIGDNFNEENSENLKVPERIKKESKIMEKILNFYITFMGGLWISRGESFFLRLFRKDIINKVLEDIYSDEESDETLYFYGGMLYAYGKNIFYYKYISENVRLGRQRFYLPYKSTSKTTYSNLEIIRLFDESVVATLLQDINPKDIKIYSKNKQLIQIFKETFGKDISTRVKEDDNQFITTIYQDLQALLNKKNLISTLQSYLTTQDVYRIKENLYNIDFRITRAAYQEIKNYKNLLLENYHDNAILGICSILKETLTGYLLCQAHENREGKQKKKGFQSTILTDIYLNDILHLQLSTPQKTLRKEIFLNLYEQYKDILETMITLDDNQDFLRMGSESREFFIENKNPEEIKKNIIGEDILRLRGYFKNITYYNKRYLIPK